MSLVDKQEMTYIALATFTFNGYKFSFGFFNAYFIFYKPVIIIN